MGVCRSFGEVGGWGERMLGRGCIEGEVEEVWFNVFAFA